MKFLKELFQKKQNDFFKLKNCEFEKEEYDNGEWITYQFNLRSKKFGWLGSMHTEPSATPYFGIKNLRVMYRYGNFSGEMHEYKVIHGTTDLKLGRIFWFNQDKGQIANLEEWQLSGGKVTDKYAYPTTITFEESDCYKAKFKPNQFNCWVKSDCFEKLMKLVERDNVGNFHVGFNNEIKPSQNDMWHYLDFAKDNELQLPTKSMWGISEDNAWEAIPHLSFESKKIRVKQED